MTKVYKFDIFSSYMVSPTIFTSPGGCLNDSFKVHYRSDSDWIIPLPKYVKVENIDNDSKRGTLNLKELVDSIKVDFTFEDKLFIHSDCSIPRAKVTQKYTKVLKPNKADICVIPTPSKEVETELISVFVNRLKGKVYTIRTEYTYRYINNTRSPSTLYLSPEVCKTYPIGTKPVDINPLLKGSSIEEINYYGVYKEAHTNENWKDFLESSLVYCGNSVIVGSKYKWIGDYLYNTMHNIVTEDRILATLGDSTNELNKDAYDNIKEMLQSLDETVVGLGLKALAEMDYKKYFNTAIHLLNTVNRSWKSNPMRQNVSVKYMLKFLGNWDYIRECYSKHIEQEDFNVLKQVIEDDFRSRQESTIMAFKSRFPFVKLQLDYNFSINPNLNDDENQNKEA